MPVPKFAVFGHPIAHSLSPRLHVLFGAQAGIDVDYTRIDAPTGQFAAAIRAFFAAGGRGANVTLPHKAAAFALADARTATAQRLGVANVLTPLPDGGIEADSNDGAGVLADLRGRCGVDPAGRSALLLGAGGAACAAAFALLDAGVARLAVANRTRARADALAARLDRPESLRVLAWDELADSGTFDLVVNATSAGVQHATLALPASLLNAKSAAYDLSYGPAARGFTDWALQSGCEAAFDGLGMLVETAAASFARWHGVRPDTGAALAALRAVPL
ncbi:MAG TPA: shikimate dehydrogenase [Rhodanobacteraceae bacterium]